MEVLDVKYSVLFLGVVIFSVGLELSWAKQKRNKSINWKDVFANGAVILDN